MIIRKSTILFLSSCLFLATSTGKTSSLQEAIEAFNKEKRLKVVLEEDKNIESKEQKAKENLFLQAIQQGTVLTPLADRIATENHSTKKKKRVLKDIFTAKLLDDIDQGTKLVIVKAPVQKIDWTPYNKLSQKIKERDHELQEKEKATLTLIEELESKKQEHKEKKEEKATLDILIQRLTRLQTLLKKSILYTDEEKEKEKIIQGLELDTSEIDLKILYQMLPETNKIFLDVKTKILTLEKEIIEIEKEIQAFKNDFDAFERNTKRLFMAMEDIHDLDDSDFNSETSKKTFAKFDNALKRLKGSINTNNGDYILILKDKVISHEILNFFFGVYQDFESKISHLQENNLFKRLINDEKTHELTFEEEALQLYLKRKDDVQGGHILFAEQQKLDESFSAANKALQTLIKTNFYRDAQHFFDYKLEFQKDKLDIDAPLPFKIERLKKIHNFLVYHSKNTQDDLSGYLAEDDTDTTDELTLSDFIEDDYFVNKKGQAMSGSIVLPAQNIDNTLSDDLLGSMVILDASTIGLPNSLRKKLLAAQQANDKDGSDGGDDGDDNNLIEANSSNGNNSSKANSSDGDNSSWYLLKLLGLQ